MSKKMAKKKSEVTGVSQETIDALSDPFKRLKDEMDQIVSTVQEASIREAILEQARHCVCGERERQYGSPEDNFRMIASLWSDYLLDRLGPHIIEPHDVAAMMCLLKIARISSGHGKADSLVDLAGYAACGGECQAKQQPEG